MAWVDSQAERRRIMSGGFRMTARVRHTQEGKNSWTRDNNGQQIAVKDPRKRAHNETIEHLTIGSDHSGEAGAQGSGPQGACPYGINSTQYPAGKAASLTSSHAKDLIRRIPQSWIYMRATAGTVMNSAEQYTAVRGGGI